MNAAIGWMLVSGLCFAASSAFAKAASTQYGPVELMLYRCAFIVVAVALYAQVAGLALRTRLWGAHFARSAAGVGPEGPAPTSVRDAAPGRRPGGRLACEGTLPPRKGERVA